MFMQEQSAELIGQIEQAIVAWHAKNDKQSLQQHIFAKLDKSRDEVLLKLLGFDKDCWHGWRIDHCNNRSGNSVAGEYLREVQHTLVNDWLAQVALPQLSEETQQQLRTSFNNEFIKTLQVKIKEAAQRKASDYATALVDGLVPVPPIDQYLQLKSLITSTPQN